MRKNIIFEFVFLLLLVTIIVTSISLYNLKTVSIESSLSNAKTLSAVVKSGLSSHIEEHNLNSMDEFLASITKNENIKDIWIARSEKLNQQYNKINYNSARDKIDEDALKSGAMKYELHEEFIDTNLRISIPYNLESYNANNCIKCHSDFKEGETIATVSMIMDITKLKESGLKSIYLIGLVTLIAVLIVYMFGKKLFGPYFKLYSKLKNNINQAKLGKFDTIKLPENLDSEVAEVTKDYNKLIEIFKETSTSIDEKLHGFVDYRYSSSNFVNPLEESKNIIDNLSNLYQFKKQVELDNTKEEIYTRISQVFKNKFEIDNFTIFEIDNKKSKMNIVASNGESLHCLDCIKNSPELCRASRTKNDVLSIEFHNSCQYYNKEDKFYYCMNISVNQDLNLIIHFTTDSKDQLNEIKQKSAFIKRYLKEATPAIEVKLLMNALQESAFTDGLTGLYNRKYLEETLKKLVPQTKRNNKKIGLLMLDMDHFKAVNDEYGHDIGDKVLKELARILNENLRESDIIVRYGGEEFMVLLMGVDDEQKALEVAAKIGEKVRENEIDVYAGATIKKTISIGLSMFPDDSSNFDTVIKNADIALYEAKSSGRDKVVRFEKEQVSKVELF